MMKTLNRIHIPVLANEIIANLNIKSNGIYIDATAGFGGHSSKIASQLKTGKLYCLDQDANAIAHLHNLFRDSKQVNIIQTNFSQIDNVVNTKVDGIIFDLGVSSLMFDDPKRGFSYKLEGPLDMRMDQRQQTTACSILNTYTRTQLIDIFKKYGDVANPTRVVQAIIKAREDHKLNSTIELAEIIGSCFKGSLNRKHPAKVYFQALRIEVNKELQVLETALSKAVGMLKKGGRLLVITFHSLEDRIVKNYFRQLSEIKDLYGKDVPLVKLTKPEFKLITKKPIIPTEQEIMQNNRSHSAKLRIIQKI